jgi:hypothetical protein
MSSHEFWTPADFEAHLGVPPATQAQWRSRRVGPPFLRLCGGRVLYRVADVEAWLDRCAVPTAPSIARDQGHGQTHPVGVSTRPAMTT